MFLSKNNFALYLKAGSLPYNKRLRYLVEIALKQNPEKAFAVARFFNDARLLLELRSKLIKDYFSRLVTEKRLKEL